ncbi:MAG: hypothetical protein KAJ48_09065, partial [Elusimicrobiales bacterium]|nr:hypothetical protein [Elusimicrobiales bacterium]
LLPVNEEQRRTQQKMNFPTVIMLWGWLIFGYNFVTYRLWRYSATRSSFLVSFENQSAKCQVNSFSEPKIKIKE